MFAVMYAAAVVNTKPPKWKRFPLVSARRTMAVTGAFITVVKKAAIAKTIRFTAY